MGDYSITATVAEGMIGGATTYAQALGESPVINIYEGTPPANAAATLGSATLLATITAPTTPITTTTDTGTAGRATWAAMTPVTVTNSGTADFFRTETSGGTVIDQGGIATSDASMVVDTTAFSAGSTLSVSSRTNDLPYGP